MERSIESRRDFLNTPPRYRPTAMSSAAAATAVSTGRRTITSYSIKKNANQDAARLVLGSAKRTG
jgi:hypothetical protein